MEKSFKYCLGEKEQKIEVEVNYLVCGNEIEEIWIYVEGESEKDIFPFLNENLQNEIYQACEEELPQFCDEDGEDALTWYKSNCLEA